MFIVTIVKDGWNEPIFVAGQHFNEANYLPLNQTDIPQFVSEYYVYESDENGYVKSVVLYKNVSGTLVKIAD